MEGEIVLNRDGHRMFGIIGTLTIIKLEDDWFLVEYRFGFEGYSWYKCDQFEGLIKFLKDKGI